MMRYRSRAVSSSKQAPMADQSSQQSSPNYYYINRIPSFFGSPRFRALLTIKGSSNHFETEKIPMISSSSSSPTSILDHTKLISLPFENPFPKNKNQPQNFITKETKHSWDNSDAKGIGLSLVDTLVDEKSEANSSSTICNGSKVLIGTKLRVQIPTYLAKGSTQNSNSNSSSNTNSNANSPVPFSKCVSVREIELSEDYTCVIARGANPRTTHIFDNCIVGSYYTVSDSGHFSTSAPENFLDFCRICKKNLEQKNDIYIYRGDRAFCSRECRHEDMLLDDEVGNPEF